MCCRFPRSTASRMPLNPLTVATRAHEGLCHVDMKEWRWQCSVFSFRLPLPPPLVVSFDQKEERSQMRPPFSPRTFLLSFSPFPTAQILLINLRRFIFLFHPFQMISFIFILLLPNLANPFDTSFFFIHP